jgi:hypothetical protein
MVRMSSYSTSATPAPSGPALSAMTWMYVATIALLAALSMATLAVADRLAAAALLLLVGAAALVFVPLVRRTRRYAEALLDAEAQLNDRPDLGAARIDGLGVDLPPVNVGGNLTVLQEAAGTVDPSGQFESRAWGSPPTQPLVDVPPPEGALQNRADSGEGNDGERVLVPASRPGDSWSDTVARITYLQRPSRRGSAARTGR